MAKKLGLSGWVKNESNNMVLITAEGEEEKLKALYEWAKKGSILAQVMKIEEAIRLNPNSVRLHNDLGALMANYLQFYPAA